MAQTRPENSSRNGLTETQRESAAAAIIKKYWGRRRLAVRLFEALLKPLAWLSRSEVETSLNEVGQILVFEPGSLGDMVMLMPFLKSLRARFPSARLSLLCRTSGSTKHQGYATINQASFETLLLDQGFVDELIPLTVPWLMNVSVWKKYNPFSLNWPRFAWRLRQLRGQNFDLAFPGGRSDVRYNLVLWLTGARRRVGYGYAGGGFLLTDVAVPDIERPHQTELSLQLLEHLDISAVRNSQLLNLSPSDEAFSAKFLREHGVEIDDLIVGVHPGSRVPTRQWGEGRFQEVARQIVERWGAKVIWFAEPKGTAAAYGSQSVISASLPLREFLAVLSRCQFLVCNESGPMHLAAGVGVPVVSVFGSGFPEWFKPLGEGHRIVIRRDMWCRPCADHCIFGEPYCLRLISVEQVMEAVTETVKGLRRMSSTAEAR